MLVAGKALGWEQPSVPKKRGSQGGGFDAGSVLLVGSSLPAAGPRREREGRSPGGAEGRLGQGGPRGREQEQPRGRGCG